ncbi:MAG: CARDB domain-containing protein [Acidobacteriota bacterium]
MISSRSRTCVSAWAAMALLMSAGLAHAAARWAVGIEDPAGQLLLRSMEATSDGGCVLVGERFSGVNVDAWCGKLDAQGNVSWMWAFGGAVFYDTFTDVCPLADGSYFVTGLTCSYGAGDADLWCLLLGPTGNIIWQKTYGGAGDDYGGSGRALAGGGFIVAGTTESSVSGSKDTWCLRLDASGNVIWQRAYGGAGVESSQCVRPTSDNGFIVSGVSSTFASPKFQIWCLNLDSSGGVKWQMGYGISQGQPAMNTRIHQTSDGGYIMSATFWEAGGMGGSRIVKLAATGAVSWQTGFPDTDPAKPWLSDVRQTSDGGYVAAGMLRVGAMGHDAWMAKLNAGGALLWQKSAAGPDQEESVAARVLSDGGFLFAGNNSHGSERSTFVGRTDSMGEIDPSCNPQPSSVVPAYPALPATPTTAAIVDTAVIGVASTAAPSAVPAVVTLHCSSPPAPDLTGSWSNVKFKKKKLNATMVCVNSGSAAAGPFTIKVYFSKKNGTGRKATLVKTVDVPGLGAFGAYSFKVKAKPGTKDKYVIADTDSANAVAEDDEGNNKAAHKFR